jgi:hypothetical protein
LYTNTVLSNKRQYFTVTAESHPLYGKCYAINSFSRSFGVTLVMYVNDDGLEKSMNVTFTSLNIINPFIEINKGRCNFLYDDMRALEGEMKKALDRLECQPNCVIV